MEDGETVKYQALAEGSVVGNYRIVSRLGVGGMGEVYLAEDTQLHRQAALKFLAPSYASDRTLRAQFLHEARAAAALEHPNIVTVYHVGEHQGRPFLAMEYVAGKTLKQVIAEGPLPTERAAAVFRQLCEALTRAHAAGVVHYDIKPANIMLDVEDRARILDFGVAAVHGHSELSATGATAGTAMYMSPEQLLGATTDTRSDIWSAGAVLYEMLTGLPPFRGEYEQAVKYSVVNELPADPARHNPSASAALSRLALRALEKEPSRRFQTVAEMLAFVDSAIGFSRSAAPEGGLPSVAVLPFVNLSDDREQEYFCDGIAEDIINDLTNVEGLRVAARTSAFAFKGKNVDVREIGEKLGVSAVLEGSVRRSGSRLRITAQLVGVRDGYHMWSERFDREAHDVFAIQEEISLAIVDRLKVRLVKGERDRLVRRQRVDLEAYNRYLRGRYFWSRRYEGGLQKGMQFFKEAIAVDPLFAPAHAGMADCYNLLGLFGHLPPGEAYPKAKIAAAEALRIDDGLAEAHTSMGAARMFYDWNWDEAERELRRAIQLNPGYATAREWYGLYLVVRGRLEEAVAEVRRALELDPLSLVINSIYGLAIGFAGRYDEAVAHHLKTVELDADFPLTHFFLGATYTEMGEYEKAAATYRTLAAVTSDSPYALGFLGNALANAGRLEEARSILEKLTAMESGRYVSPFYRAVIHMGLGNIDRALDHLELALDGRESFMAFLGSWPFFDGLRGELRFQQIIGAVGLARTRP